VAATYHFPLIDAGCRGDVSGSWRRIRRLYVLPSYTGSGSSATYRLDLYDPDGNWLSRTTGINADKLTVNYWRDLYTLNYQVLKLPNGQYPPRTEPSVSHWIPSTPPGATPTPTRTS
jgi:hypothetical protein